MGVLERALETYNYHKNLVGKSVEGKFMLAPIAHTAIDTQITITLDEDGGLVDITPVDSKKSKTIIPVTETSLKRTGKSPVAHPLSDKLSYYLPDKLDNLLSQLKAWSESKYSHPKLKPILTYLESGTILKDLTARKDLWKIIGYDEESGVCEKEPFVRWEVYTDDFDAPTACWLDETLFNSWIEYYESTLSGKKIVCMISGNEDIQTEAFPKSIGSYSNPKIISANDKDGLVFRGRFANQGQALKVGFDAVQKSHNAIKWLIANGGCKFGNRTYICWNPKGYCVPNIAESIFGKDTHAVEPTDYKKALWNKLAGYHAELPDNADVIIAAFDAASKGRLAVVYYNELCGSDFLQRLSDWDEHCCWYNGKYGIQSPSVEKIVRYAYGIPRINGKTIELDVKDGVMGTQTERLVDCRINKARIPQEIVRRLLENVAFPEHYRTKSVNLWNDMVSTTCAVINKYHYERNGENVMEWSLEHPDRSFQFGRLLAVLNKTEQDFLRKKKIERQTSALDSLSSFKCRPLKTYEAVNRKLMRSYLNRCDEVTRNTYHKYTTEIMALIAECSDESTINKPLDATYIIGYELQMKAFRDVANKNKTKTEIFEEEN